MGALRARPGLLGLFVASIVGRLPMGAIALVAILRVEEMTGSYAQGGAAAGTFAIVQGLFAPVLGRLSDRHGQARMLVPTTAVHAAALSGFALLSDGAGIEAALALMALAGASQPPLSASQRAIWSDSVTDPGDRHRLYSFEAAVFEIVYICGPLVIVGVVGAWSIRAAAAACALLTVAGAAPFAASALSRAWRPHPGRVTTRAGALASAGVRALFVVFFLFGTGMAGVEIAVAAFAAEEGSKSAVGPVLAVWGLGSMAGGFAVARLAPPTDAARRVAVMFAAMGAGTAALVAAPDLLVLVPLIFVAGIAIAPGLAVAFGLLSDVAPTGTVTEAQTIISTGIGVGFGLGSVAGGWLVEAASHEAGFALAASGLALAAVVAAARRGVLRPAAAG